MLIRPVTPARIRDLESLMRSNAITASCWDIFPRRLNADGAARRKYWRSKGVRAAEGNRRDAVALVRSGRPFGLIAYDAKEPVGFISAGPRAAYPRVDTSKVTPRIDDVPLWVVPCLYVRRSHRGGGVTTALLRAAVDYAAKRAAPAVGRATRSAAGLGPARHHARHDRRHQTLTGALLRRTCAPPTSTSSRSLTDFRAAS